MNCCSASVTGLMLSHCVSHCRGGDVPQVQQGKRAHLLVTTLVIYCRRLLHTLSLRQVGKWIAANPASDLHMTFSKQGGEKGVKSVVFCSSKKLNSRFSYYSHHL